MLFAEFLPMTWTAHGELSPVCCDNVMDLQQWWKWSREAGGGAHL